MSHRYSCVGDVRLVDGQVAFFVLCDDNQAFLYRVTYINSNVETESTELDGVTPYVPVGTVGICDPVGIQSDTIIKTFCDDDGITVVPFLIIYQYDEFGSIISVTEVEIDGVTPYVPVGTVRVCEESAGWGVGGLDPNGVVADRSLTVPVGAPVSLLDLGAFAVTTKFVVITVDVLGGPVRVTFDGSAPSITNGHFLNSGQQFVWTTVTAEAARFSYAYTAGIVIASEFVRSPN